MGKKDREINSILAYRLRENESRVGVYNPWKREIMVDALVTPSVLRWARENVRYSTQAASKVIGVSEEQLTAWEEGVSHPSFNVAKKIAKEYNQPLAFFYLSHPPEPEKKLADFRKLDLHKYTPESHKLEVLVQHLRSQQEWLREDLIEEGSIPLGFIGSASSSTPVDDLAQNIRDCLNVTFEEQSCQKDEREALNYLVQKAEEIGVYISRRGGVEPEEARGIALSDDYAPLIYINTKDSYASRQFTLAHELVHLWINNSGISNLVEEGTSSNPALQEIEVFCNKVASRILVPEHILDYLWEKRKPTHDAREQVKVIAKKCRVSNELIARRLYDKKRIKKDEYVAIRETYAEIWKNEQNNKKEKKEGGNYDNYASMVRANGFKFTSQVIEAYHSGRINMLETSNLLDVKVNNLNTYFQKVRTMREK